jgi:hypothetical protein
MLRELSIRHLTMGALSHSPQRLHIKLEEDKAKELAD